MESKFKTLNQKQNDNVCSQNQFIRTGLLKDLSLSPARHLASSLSLPTLGPVGFGMTLPTQSVIKLPAIDPLLQSAGLQTINANPLNAAGNPINPPPVPLIPPSLFSSVPSLPELRNPLFSDQYWRGGKYGWLGGDYLRGGDYYRGDFARGRGIHGLLPGELNDPEKIKKALYRHDLIHQMDDNKLRRYDRYNKSRLENELEEERLRRERGYLDNGYGYDIGERRRRIMDNQERAARYLKEDWHRRDEDRYKYKSFRKGSEPVEAYWLGDPHHPHDSKYWKNAHGQPPDWWHKKYWSHPGWWNSKDPYPYPPVGGDPRHRDWWWYGDREGQWKEKGYWHQGKWVPIDVANHIQEKVGEEVKKLRHDMAKQEVDMQSQLNEMKKQGLNADFERQQALEGVKQLKEKLSDQQLTEDIRHQYMYNQLLDKVVEKDSMLKKSGDYQFPDISNPLNDAIKFKIPNSMNTPRFDDIKQISKPTKLYNDLHQSSVERVKTKVNMFDADYLNQVNSRRLDSLDRMDSKEKLSKDNLVNFLEQETSKSWINLHQDDVQNNLLNNDILRRDELPSISNYQTPLKVVDKFREFPNVDAIQDQYSKIRSPSTNNQKFVVMNYSSKKNL
ncbi:UNKNOWN [Stylonychia lemnae]|uniref:Uncharacterized protein n=1 Tax=Stylonychia lemnae TaxID=5949 RepID=A0A078A337_STYLE|nr:UNKNOWN [Stylonychia lemnae]|eukprot:CDW76693.1 UNKNOWN [Stylonychia lemnae]